MSGQNFFARFRVGAVGRASTIMTAALAIRGALLAAYLIATTRWLGVHDYGTFAGAAAVVLVFAPAAGWGATLHVQRSIALRSDGIDSIWAASLRQVVLIGICLIAIAALANQVLGGSAPWLVVLVLGLSELVALPLVLLVAAALQASAKPLLTSVAICIVPAIRLLGLAVMMIAGEDPDLVKVVLNHLAGSVIGMVLVMGLAYHVLTLRPSRPIGTRDLLAAGTPYALGGLLGGAYLEIDKLLILWMLGSSAVGPYAAAFRVAMIGMIPVMALTSVVLPRLMERRDRGGEHRLGRATLAASAGFGASIALFLAIVSAWVPKLFGEGFEPAGRIALAMVPWILTQSLRMAACTILTGEGLQRLRVKAEGAGLIVMVAVCCSLLYIIGPFAAVVGLIASDLCVLAIALVCGRIANVEPGRLRWRDT